MKGGSIVVSFEAFVSILLVTRKPCTFLRLHKRQGQIEVALSAGAGPGIGSFTARVCTSRFACWNMWFISWRER